MMSLSRVWLFVSQGLYSPCNCPGQNTGVDSLFLLQGIFPTQGLNLGLPHCRWILYQLSHQGSQVFGFFPCAVFTTVSAKCSPHGLPSGSVVKNPPANAGDAGDADWIPGLGRSLGEGNGNPLQYSCLGNLMDREAWQATGHGVARVRHNFATK